MGKKLYSIAIKGKQNLWSFEVYLDPKYISDYRDDGLEVNEIINIIPVWAVDLGLTRPWCFVQDVFNFKNPFSGK